MLFTSHPFARVAEEPYGHGLAAFVILQRDHRSFCGTSSSLSNDSHTIVKLERQLRQEDGILGGSEVEHGRVLQPDLSRPFRSDANRNANRGKLRKKSCELLRAF